MSSSGVGSSGRGRGGHGSWIRALLAFYLATPAFAVADLVFHLPLRVALPGDGARLGYYAAVTLLGLLCWRHPRATPWVGMAESATNLVILMLGVLLPLWDAPAVVAAGGALPGPELLLARVTNLAVGGAVMVVSFHRARASLVGEIEA